MTRDEIIDRCNATVFRRDTYRYTGRGKTGFELLYQKGRCRRSAKGGDLCHQHASQERRGWHVLRYESPADERSIDVITAERERCATEAHIESMVQGLSEDKAKLVAASIRRGK